MKKIFVFKFIFDKKEMESTITATDMEEARSIFEKNHMKGCEIIDCEIIDPYWEK
jgi:hypothetical protein